MACRFELVLHGDEPVRLRAAGEEALDEIDRLEAQLSIYRPSSEVSQLNARAAAGPVRVEPRLFALLQHAHALWALTDGAFDPTVGPLLRAWGFSGTSGPRPSAIVLAEARAQTGMEHVVLDAGRRTVAFARPGVQLDLGGIGKGYALDEAARLLREAGVTCALLHGGTSTVVALGAPPDAEAWTVAVPRTPVVSSPEDVAAAVALRDEALSVSAGWGKTVEVDGETYGHVLDPRSGHPVKGATLSAVVLPEAAAADA
ncbi:MAG: FAD:protein FMN transferase, partial [Bacteroidota bacterium]